MRKKRRFDLLVFWGNGKEEKYSSGLTKKQAETKLKFYGNYLYGMRAVEIGKENVIRNYSEEKISTTFINKEGQKETQYFRIQEAEV